MTLVGDKESRERQRTDSRSRRELESQLRRNERIWAGFREIEIQMIGAQSLGEVVEVLVTRIPALFPAVDCVSLVCVDPDFELARLMSTHPQSGVSRLFIPADRAWLEEVIPTRAKPWLGPCDNHIQTRLFPACAARLGSCVIAPLVLQGELIGSFNQGSRDAGHFSADAATDLLEHLAAVTAMCVDSAANRERLKRDGLTDALTGVANRRLFERRLREELSLRERRKNSLSLLLVDLDHFKELNDRHGHQAGDRALQQVALTLTQGLRVSDVLARYGGEEFALLLPDTKPGKALEIAERLRAHVAELIIDDPAGSALKVSVSIGVACLEQSPGVESRGGDPGFWLMRQADVALYRAKSSGRNRVMTADRS